MPENAQESLYLLLDASLLLASKTEVPEVLKTIMELSSRVVGAETASLLLLDPKTSELYFDVALGLGAELSRYRLKVGQGIAGTVAQNGKPAIINDVHAESRWSPELDRLSGFQTRSILAAPMTIKGKLVGVVEAINHVGGPFTFEHLRVFEAFAAQAASAIENARLFASLREEKAKLETVFARMKDGAILTDERGKILLINDSARKYFAVGDRAEGTIMRELAQVKVQPPLSEVLTTTKPLILFDAVREAPKTLILAGTASYLEFERTSTHPGWRGRLFVFRDVTEERREEALKRSFLSLISHKLKTPLSSIIGYAQILSEETGPSKSDDRSSSPVRIILGQGRKLADLVDRLLRFTTLEEMDTSAFILKPFKIDQAISEAVLSLQDWLSEHHGSIIVKTNPELTVLGNPELIRDVIKNLIENGVKFNRQHEKEVTLWADRQNGLIMVHVQDRGSGITPEDQDRIFDKFYQIESSFTGQVDGWGLGLPFCRKVVEHHGGKIAIASRINEGTEVTFSLRCPAQ